MTAIHSHPTKRKRSETTPRTENAFRSQRVDGCASSSFSGNSADIEQETSTRRDVFIIACGRCFSLPESDVSTPEYYSVSSKVLGEALCRGKFRTVPRELNTDDIKSCKEIHPELLTLFQSIIECEESLITHATYDPKLSTQSIQNSSKNRQVCFNSYDLSNIDHPEVKVDGSDDAMRALLDNSNRILYSAVRLRTVLCEKVAGVAVLAQLLELLDILEEYSHGRGLNPAWGVREQKAAMFYTKELRILCIGYSESSLRSNFGLSRIHCRYQETISSLVRYELKKLLNNCQCNLSNKKLKESNTAAAISCPLLCSCVSVDLSTGNLKFNVLDPASLLSHALRYIQPMRTFMGIISGRINDSESNRTPSFMEDSMYSSLSAFHISWNSDSNSEIIEKIKFLLLKSHESDLNHNESFDSDMESRNILIEDYNDILAYIAGSRYLHSIFSLPNVCNSVQEGCWMRIEKWTNQYENFTENVESYLNPLSNLSSLIETCIDDARNFNQLEKLILNERRNLLLEELNSESNRRCLRSDVVGSKHPDLFIQFPSVSCGCCLDQ